MSVNTIESPDAQPIAQKQNSELIYRLEDRPPLPQTLFAACQHLLAMFVAVITPALLICQALGLPAQDTQHIISMSLFASGVASIIQIKAWGPVGSGLLSIQGTSFNFVAPLIMGGTALKTGGADVPTMMAALFGTLMLASCTEMVLSRVLHLARRIITPLVSGVVVMIIGLSLIQVGLTSIGGGYAAMADHTFGAPKNLLLAGIVLALINACFIAGYTLVDGTGVRLAGSALGYTLWTFFMNGFCLLCWAMVARRREASRYLRQHWKKGILGGVGTMGSYGLALWAMTQAPLAVVAALRETSILFGALIAFIVLKEQLMPLRIVAACGIAAGAILLRLA